MSRSTFRVLFYLKRNAPKKNGFVPVICRITVNGKISQFSCKLDVEEKLWNVNLDRMSGRSIVAQETNRLLDNIRIGINKAYQEIMDRDGYVSAEKVRNAFLGMGQNHKTLLAVFRQHNEDYAKQELSRFKLDVHRNMARYVLSNSKRFGLLPKTLPHSVSFSIRSQEN